MKILKFKWLKKIRKIQEAYEKYEEGIWVLKFFIPLILLSDSHPIVRLQKSNNKGVVVLKSRKHKRSVLALGVERVRMHWVVDSQVMTINPVVKLPSVPDCRSLIINVLSRWKVENIIILWLRWPYLYFLPNTNKPHVRFRRIKNSEKPILHVTNRWWWMKISTGDIGFRWSSKRNWDRKAKVLA